MSFTNEYLLLSYLCLCNTLVYVFFNRTFVENLLEVPKLILAVVDPGGSSSNFFSIDIVQALLQEGSQLADTIGAGFMTTTANFTQQSKYLQCPLMMMIIIIIGIFCPMQLCHSCLTQDLDLRGAFSNRF